MIQQVSMLVNQEVMEEWIEYRKFKKKPLSQFALDKSIKFLERYGPEQQRHIVDTAIMNDWQGLHHVDMPKQSTTRELTLQEDLQDTSWAYS